MARLFLSYSREDVATAKALAGSLEHHGHQVWWDRQLHGGSRFAAEIEAELKQADVVMVLWSSSSIRSSWVQDEATEGRETDRLLPLAIDGSLPPLGFRQFHAIDLAGWNGRSNAPVLKDVLAAVERKCATQLAGSVAATPPVAPPRARKRWAPGRLALAGLPILLLAIVVSIYWPLSSPERAEAENLRVRLGSFSNLSTDVPAAVPAMMREELLAALATDAIIIASSKEAGDGGDAAAYAVSASVRKVTDYLRFTIHVTSEESGDTLWTGRIDRPLSSLEVAPRQAAVAASQILRCGLTAKANYPRKLPDETLSTYLNYCQEYYSDSLGAVSNPTRGLDIARRVVQATPDFSYGWSGRAWMALWAAQAASAAAATPLQAEAADAARQAIKHDSRNSEAYHALAGTQPRNAYRNREVLFLKSISVRPGDCGCEHLGYGSFQRNVGRHADALQSFKRAQDMVPFSADVNASFAESLFTAGREAEARAVVGTVMELWPNNAVLHRLIVRSALWTKRYDEALETLADSRAAFSDKERQYYSAALRALQSGSAAAKASAIKELQILDGDAKPDRPLLIASLAALGAEREALALASRSLGAGGLPDQFVLFEPPLAAARRTPEFAALVERLGLVRYWRQSKKLPDFCRERNAPPLCRRLS